MQPAKRKSAAEEAVDFLCLQYRHKMELTERIEWVKALSEAGPKIQVDVIQRMIREHKDWLPKLPYLQDIIADAPTTATDRGLSSRSIGARLSMSLLPEADL